MDTHNHQMTASHNGGHGDQSLPHPNDPAKQKEHLALLDLLPHAETTHVAVNDGSWFDPSTWKNGEIPPAGAKVLIPQGRTVLYDGESDVSIKIVRVDGAFQFAHNKNTKLVVDTLITDTKSTLQIGTEANPIQADKTAQIIIDGSTPIDKNWDPLQISRGVVTHGKVRIHGADKLDFVSLAKDVKAGDSELVLKAPSTGWRVGDQIVLGGTNRDENGSHADNSKFQDEVLTITAINGNVIKFVNNDIKSGPNNVLRFDHTRPEGFEDKLNLYVANTTRNIVFETANVDQVPTQQRGHTMFMHNPDVVVQNAGFYNLGRSDKSKLVDDVGQNRDSRPGTGTNPRGRYSLHFHRTGVDDINSTPSLAKGNVVVGSPGWGIVHHDSHAILEDNVVFDVLGAGIAAEDGNELGAWRNNITIKTTGTGARRPQQLFAAGSTRLKTFDLGATGEGYWVQGAGQVEMENNVAISAVSGINLFGGADGGAAARTVNEFLTKNLPPEMQKIAGGKDTVNVTHVPLRKFSGFESYNADKGIIFWARVRGDQHDVRSVAEDFKLWNIQERGVDIWYSSKIDLVDGLILGDPDNPEGEGVTGNEVARDILYQNLHIEGFERGLEVVKDSDASTRALGSTLENSYLNNTENLFRQAFNKPRAFPEHFEIVGTEFKSSNPNKAPVAQFEYAALEGLQVGFDASLAFDPDPVTTSANENFDITSYGWDFNNDGVIDKFGRQVTHQFDQPGPQTVSLKVWDNQGATGTLTKTLQFGGTSDNPPDNNPEPTPPTPTENPDNGPTPNQGSFIRGTAKDDTLFGGSQSQKIKGLKGEDIIHAGEGDDIIYGNGDNDQLYGDRGNDILYGNNGNDTMVGVNVDDGLPGLGEQDVLIGGRGADTYVLGDASKVYYDDGDPNSTGDLDFALIKGFKLKQGDLIQLNGQANDYRLGAAPQGTSKNAVGIFRQSSGEDELIGVVQNEKNLTLTSPAFKFV